MEINRSGFYKWQARRVASLSGAPPSQLEIKRAEARILFAKYHELYPSHGYRWLNAKIKLDYPDKNYSDQFAHRVCKYLGIKSTAKKVKRYGKSKARKEMKQFPNLLLKELQPNAPLEIVVSDMTAFYVGPWYYELTLFMDLFNNEIIGYYLTNTRGNPEAYHQALRGVLKRKATEKELEMILHTDQGSVYASRKFNEKLPLYGIVHSMSKPGTPTENGAMEAINGWVKEELFTDFWQLKMKAGRDVDKVIADYIYYFNYERPAYALGYLTPIQYKQKYYEKCKNCLLRVD